MPRWLRSLAHELDLSIADEAELRGFVKGLALGLVVYLLILVLTTLPFVLGGA